LTEEDTFQYLNLCMRQQGLGAEDKEIFSREVSTKILTISHGNFRKINTLAEDSLQSSYGSGANPGAAGDATSFMVLLEHVRDTDDQATNEPPSRQFPLLSKRKKIIIATGIALVTILLFVSLGREDKKTDVSHHPKKAPTISNPQTTPTTPNKKADATPPPTQPAPEITVSPTVKPVAPTSAAVVAVEPPPPAPSAPTPTNELTKEPTPSTPEVVTPPEVETNPPASTNVATAKPVNDPAPSMPVTSEPPLAPTLVTGATEPAPKPIAPDPKIEPTQDPQPAAVEISPLEEKKSSEAQLLITARSPKKNGITPLLTPEPVTKHKDLLAGKTETTSRLIRPLPPKNLAAGNKWLAGEKNDHYTLQVIVLAADQAGDKLQGILHNEDQTTAGKFIILKKSTPPATVILFYGEYPTLTAAKEARNNLPPSLQKYTPYPVAIKQAVEKSKR
jgi:hypothetical protein